MKYNENIVLDILSSEFFGEIEEYTLECIWQMTESDIWDIIDEGADYAELEYIDGLEVIDYEVKEEDETEYISGTLEVSACIDGYAHWDGEDINMGSGFCELDMSFGFLRCRDEYLNLELEYIY